MAQLDDIVTKEFVREEIVKLRGDMDTGFAKLEAAMAKETNRVIESAIKWYITSCLGLAAVVAAFVSMALNR